MEKIFIKYRHLIFFAIAFILLYPTFQKGYIFLLDWGVYLNISFSDINLQADTLSTILFKFLEVVFSFGIFQRIFLFGVLFFLGVAGFRLAKKTGNVYARYFCGIFLMFNPFIYARLVEQPGVALGSLLFFWFFIYFLEYLEDRKGKKMFLASIFAGLSISVFAHSVFFIGLVAVFFLLFDLFYKKDYKFFLKTTAILCGVVILINTNWLVYSSIHHTGVSEINNFSQADWQEFATKKSGGYSIYSTVLSLQGYWGEYQDRFPSIQENPFWIAGFGIIFLLAIFGLLKIWGGKYFGKAMLVCFLLSFILAMGISSDLFKPVSIFLYKHFPMYIGLREPQKWVAIMLFIYAYLAGWGIKYILEKIKEFRFEVGIIFILTPVIFSFSAIEGMHSSFQPKEFPKEWHETKEYLQNSQGKILFFPWHSYMKMDFVKRNIVNPAQGFFGKNIIQGNNTEFGKLYSHSSDQQTLAIEKYALNHGDDFNYANFSKEMKAYGIAEIVLLKDEDWKKYFWLDIIGLDKVLEDNNLIVYKLK